MNQINPDVYGFLKKIDTFFFDVDGTLFSSEDILEEVYQESIAQYFQKNNIQYKLPTLSEILPYIGMPVKEIFRNLLPFLEEQQRDEISQNVLDVLVRKIYLGKGKHYDGVKETLKYLYKKKYKMFSASNGRKAYIEAILKVNCIDSYFLEISCIDNITIFNKSQLVREIIQRYNLKPDSCVIIGDRESDKIAAQENHIHFIATVYGHGSPPEWEGSILKIQSIKELMEFF